MQQNPNLQTRKAERSKTRIYGVVRYYNQAAKGRVVDLSATGMALELQEPFAAAAGSRIRIESEDLGFLEGTVVWNRGGRLGVKLQLSTNALAKISSYFRFFHEEPKSTFLPG
ncbi:PilZ domain-containing protein [Rhizobiaceae bacterium BDR2-2]|uniref:PilZ domain-containing protein n=1 Tax=Ectorhizobium quercum TaxID=2965071 RepID=A0AAE3N062_9HYPH|nr:PilZ domain-containing protein [Ectorhizobium quercum]MCX8997671.1 PilZ domain-containing protein [Ectorhizobium quercum]